jgi:hypothetical protein
MWDYFPLIRISCFRHWTSTSGSETTFPAAGTQITLISTIEYLIVSMFLPLLLGSVRSWGATFVKIILKREISWKKLLNEK